jgi:hypothetical protein
MSLSHPAIRPPIPNLRAVLSQRLAFHGRRWSWLIRAQHRGHPIIKRTHFTYPKETPRSHRKTSLPANPQWAALFGAVCGLSPAAVAALVLAWQWEGFRADQLAITPAPIDSDGNESDDDDESDDGDESDENAACCWMPDQSLTDAFNRYPPDVTDFIRFESGRTEALEHDLAAAFSHPAVEQDYGAHRHHAGRLAQLAVTGRWYAKSTFTPDGREAPHLAEAGTVSTCRHDPAPVVVSVPKAEAADALLRIARLSYGVPHEPLTYDLLCGLDGFRQRPLGPDGAAAHRRDLLFQFGIAATFRDMIAVLPRAGGPLHHGLYGLGIPDPDAAHALSRQVATHPWRIWDARNHVTIAPLGLLLHRPVADLHPIDAAPPDESPILLTALWHARLGRDDDREPPASMRDGLRWKRIADLFPGGFPDFADRAILTALRHPGATRVVEEGSASLVDFAHHDCHAWRNAWADV